MVVISLNAVSAQDEKEEVVDYARKYMHLSLATEIYRRIRYKLHNSGRWPNVLLLCELHVVFSLPFTVCHVEQMFSLLRVVKTKCRRHLQTSMLHDLLEFSIEGPPLSDFNADAAIKLWRSSCFGGSRVNQKERSTLHEHAAVLSRTVRKTATQKMHLPLMIGTSCFQTYKCMHLILNLTISQYIHVHVERSIRKWVLWILIYNIKFKSIYLLKY